DDERGRFGTACSGSGIDNDRRYGRLNDHRAMDCLSDRERIEVKDRGVEVPGAVEVHEALSRSFGADVCLCVGNRLATQSALNSRLPRHELDVRVGVYVREDFLMDAVEGAPARGDISWVFEARLL